jgi:hypothetical protein
MRPFKNQGWMYFEMMQGIMFSTAACGSHVYQPTQASPATTTTYDNTDNANDRTDDTKIPNVTSGTIAAVIGKYADETGAAAVRNSTAPMDIDEDSSVILPCPPSSTGKRTHSTMSLNSEKPPLTISDSLSLSASPSSNPSPKKQQKGSHTSGSRPSSSRLSGSCPSSSRLSGSRLSQDSHDFRKTMPSQSSMATKITPAVAMVAMQSQIGRLTDVFKKTMATPEDATAAQQSLAITRLQELDDGLIMDDKIKLIGLF